MDWDALFWTPQQKVDTIRTSDVHVYSHLDPMDTTWTKGVHVYCHLEVIVAAAGGGK